MFRVSFFQGSFYSSCNSFIGKEKPLVNFTALTGLKIKLLKCKILYPVSSIDSTPPDNQNNILWWQIAGIAKDIGYFVFIKIEVFHFLYTFAEAALPCCDLLFSAVGDRWVSI